MALNDTDASLQGRVAVIYGGGGALGGAAARAMACKGARVFLAGRTLARLEQTAQDIRSRGGQAEVAIVDAREEKEVDDHAEDVVSQAGRIDIMMNALGVDHRQGIPLAELSLADYLDPIDFYVRTHYITARAVARHMVAQGNGVILTLSTPGAKMSGPGFLNNGVASGAVETFSRILAGELGSSGVRVVCLRPDAIPEALATSHSARVFGRIATARGITTEQMLAEHARTTPLLGRSPTLANIGEFAAFVASDHAAAMTGAILNLSCGSLVD